MTVATLPAAAAFTGATVTEGQFKTALTSLHDFLAELQTQAADLASATTCAIGDSAGNYVKITGTTTITGFGTPTAAANTTRICEFGGALILTHNATSLILPTGANITTAAGDVAMFVHEGSGNWRCLFYQPKAGYSPIAGPGSSQAFATGALTATTVVATAQPAFLATIGTSVSNATGDGTQVNPIIFELEKFDLAGNYSTSTGIFTASIAGKYHFSWGVRMTDVAANHTTHEMTLTTTGIQVVHYDIFTTCPFVGQRSFSESAVVNMALNDTAKITLTIEGGSKVVDIYGTATGAHSFFSGHLIG